MTNIPFEEISKRLVGERIMLIGGAGFIGHNLSLGLANIGIETMVVDNLMVNSLIDNVYEERDPVQRQMYQNFLLDRFQMMRKSGVELRNCDARILLDLTRAFEDFRPTKVVHLSAISSAVVARQNPGLCFDLQLVTLRNAIELARTSNDQINQLIFLSSSTVYGDFEGDSVNENTRPRPKGIYANAKYMGERLLRTYNHQHGLGATIIRPSALYGERCISGRVSQKFIENALTGKPLLLEGGGDGRLDFTYITDLVDGMIRALAIHGGQHSSNTFNLTFGNARTIAELADVVKSVVPEVSLEVRPKAEDKPERGTLSTERAEQILGFKAQWSLEEGYRQYCEWYVDQWNRALRDVERN